MKKKVVVSFSILMGLVLVVCAVKGEVKRISFFKDSKISIAQPTEDEKVADLSKKLGIKLDVGVEKHKAILDRYDDIVVYENKNNDGFIVSENEGKLNESLPINVVKIFTSSEETSDFCLNFALIHGLHEKGTFETVFQIKWKKSQLLTQQKDIRISLSSLFWENGKTDANELLLYYENANCWVEKEIQVSNAFQVDYYPVLMTPVQGQKNISLNTVSQVWGTCFYGRKSFDENLLGRIYFSFGNNQRGTSDYTFFHEWWSSGVFQ